MSRTSLSIILSFCLLGFAGCGKTKVTCTNQNDYVFSCDFNRIADPATDSVYVLAFKKGSDFSSLIDTVHDFRIVWPGGNGLAIVMDDKESCDQYDWQFVFYKTGEVFKVKNITHHSRTEQQATQDTHGCGNDMSVIANDSLMNIAGNSGQSSSEIVIHIKQ